MKSHIKISSPKIFHKNPIKNRRKNLFVYNEHNNLNVIFLYNVVHPFSTSAEVQNFVLQHFFNEEFFIYSEFFRNIQGLVYKMIFGFYFKK